MSYEYHSCVALTKTEQLWLISKILSHVTTERSESNIELLLALEYCAQVSSQYLFILLLILRQAAST